MKKITLFSLGMLLPALMWIMPAMAAPIYSGTATFDFTGQGGGSTTMNWAVYGLGDTTAAAGATASDYTYLYTVTGHTGSATGTDRSITTWNIATNSAAITGAGTSSGTAPLLQAPTTGTGVNAMNAYFAGLGTGSESAFYWLSTDAPAVTTSVNMQLSGMASVAGTGAVMAPDFSAPPAGVPEPETWALLIMLSAFTMWWMRRRQGENVVEEDFTA